MQYAKELRELRRRYALTDQSMNEEEIAEKIEWSVPLSLDSSKDLKEANA